MFWNGDYSFFDYKYNIEGYSTQDFDGFGRWFYMIFTLVSITILLILLRNLKRETVIKIVKIAGIALLALEISKVSWESWWDITTGRGFNKEGLIPIYTCSMFMYTSIVAGFSRGKVQECCLAWLPTIGVVGGLSNVFFNQGLRWYPFWTFGAMHSMSFHYVMVFTGLLVAVTRTKRFEWIDIVRGFIPHLIFSALVIAVDYRFGWDYMQYYGAGGVPVFDDLIDGGKMFGVPFLGTVVMLLVYLALEAAFVAVYKLAFNRKSTVAPKEQELITSPV